MKRCPSCGEEKPTDAYGMRSNGRWRRSSCKPCERVKVRQWHKANPERSKANQRRTDLRIKYGISPEQYDVMLAAQGGVCAICQGQQVAGRRFLDVDHDHDTGQVRSLLCSLCNVMLGAARERADLLRLAADYLAAHAVQAAP